MLDVILDAVLDIVLFPSVARSGKSSGAKECFGRCMAQRSNLVERW